AGQIDGAGRVVRIGCAVVILHREGSGSAVVVGQGDRRVVVAGAGGRVVDVEVHVVVARRLIADGGPSREAGDGRSRRGAVTRGRVVDLADAVLGVGGSEHRPDNSR